MSPEKIVSKGRTTTDGFYTAKQMFTQHNAAKGLHIFGSRGETTVMKELSHLQKNTLLEPQRLEELKYSKRTAAHAYLMFLNEKKTVKSKVLVL